MIFLTLILFKDFFFPQGEEKKPFKTTSLRVRPRPNVNTSPQLSALEPGVGEE